MGIEIRIEAASGNEMREQVAQLFASVFGSVPLNITLPVPADEEPSKPARRSRSQPKADEGNAAQEPSGSMEKNTPSSGTSTKETAGEAKSSTTTDEGTVEYADVQKAVTALAAAKGRDAVISIFDEFGVDHGTKLKPEQWGEAVEKLTSALAD